MIFLLIGLGLFLFAVGFILSEKNAHYLLSGYNNLSEEDRKSVDLKSYLNYFKKFHVFLGSSYIVLGLLLNYLLGENALGIFLGVYPIIAYVFFIVRSSKYSRKLEYKNKKLSVILLIGTLIFVISVIGYGMSESKISFDSNHVQLTGMYEELMQKHEIKSIELVDQLPEIRFKSNGFAMGKIKKGYFLCENGETVKLVLNSTTKPFILFTKTNGEKVYFSAKDQSNVSLLEEIKLVYPELFQK